MGSVCSKRAPRPSTFCTICGEPVASNMAHVSIRFPLHGAAPRGPTRGLDISPMVFANLVTSAHPHSLIAVPCCNQVFHSGCITQWVVGHSKNSCPLCRTKLTVEMRFHSGWLDVGSYFLDSSNMDLKFVLSGAWFRGHDSLTDMMIHATFYAFWIIAFQSLWACLNFFA